MSSLTLGLGGKPADAAAERIRQFTDDGTVFARDARRVITEDIGKELKALSVQIRETLETDVGPALRGVRTATEHLPGTFERVDATLERIALTLRRVDRTVAEETGSLDETLDNLRSMTQDLRDLTGQLKKYPSQALFGEAPPKKGTGK